MVMVACPLCQASGSRVMVVLLDGYGVCPECHWTWRRGDLGQLVHVG